MSSFHDCFPGQFRNAIQLSKIRSAKVLFAHGVEVEALMRKLVQWLHVTNENPIDIIVNFHQRFLRIHPFADGNGTLLSVFVLVIFC